MKPDRRRRLVEIMTALPHDPAYMVSLMNEFRDELTAHARWQVARLNTWAHPDDIEALVIEYADELQACAGSWKADGGALPWVWAAARLRKVTIELVRPGSMAERPLPEGFDARDDTTPVWETHDGAVDWLNELTKLSEVDERVASLVDALGCHSDRDVSMFVEFLDRRESGEPAPSDSTAQVFDVKAATTRKVVQRVRQTLRSAELHRVLPGLLPDSKHGPDHKQCADHGHNSGRERCGVADEGPNVLVLARLEPVGTLVRELDAA